MTKPIVDIDDESATEVVVGFDGKPVRVVRDGRIVRVPMRLKDAASVSGQIAAERAHVVDGVGDGGLGLHKPGSRFAADRSAYDAVADAYDEMCRASSDAWKRGPGGHQDALAHGTEYAEGREGDRCTVCAGAAEGYLEGSPGHLARVDGKLVCVPDKRRSDCMSPADAERIKKATYDEMCRAGEQAWKNLGQH